MNNHRRGLMWPRPGQQYYYIILTNHYQLFVATVDSVARVCLDVSCVCVSAPLDWLFYVCMCIYAHIKTYKKTNLSTSLGFD